MPATKPTPVYVADHLAIANRAPWAVLAALETRHPVLRGASRDPAAKKRRAFIRFFACKEGLSREPVDNPLPEVAVHGEESFLVVGAIAGG